MGKQIYKQIKKSALLSIVPWQNLHWKFAWLHTYRDIWGKMPDAQGREQPGGRGQANSEDLLLMMILMVVLPMVTLMLLLLLLTRLISRMPAWQRDFGQIHWMRETVKKKKGDEYWI